MVSLMLDRSERLEDGCTKNPDLFIFITKDQPAQPFALLLRAPLAVKNRHMLAAADDAERIDFIRQTSRQFTICELVARHDIIHGKRQGAGKVLYELFVFAFVRIFDEAAPQRIGYGQNLFIAFFNNVHAGLLAAVSGRHYSTHNTRLLVSSARGCRYSSSTR